MAAEGHQHEITEDGWSVCAIHPDRETALRCMRCNRFMCSECAVRTPVGYICKQCARRQDDKFFNGLQADYGIIFAVTLVISLVGGFIVTQINWWIIALVIAFPFGGAVSEAAIRAVKRRRSRYAGIAAAAGAAIGALIPVLLSSGAFTAFSLPTIVFAALVTGTVYSRFQLRT